MKSSKPTTNSAANSAQCDQIHQQIQATQASLEQAQFLLLQYSLLVEQVTIQLAAARLQQAPLSVIMGLEAALALAQAQKFAAQASVAYLQWSLANLQQAFQNAGCQ